MIFQNCILMNCVTDTWMDGLTHTDKPKAICPFNFSKVGGINKQKAICPFHFTKVGGIKTIGDMLTP